MKQLNISVEDTKILNTLLGIGLVLIIWAIGLNNLSAIIFMICFFAYLLIDLNTKRIIIDDEGIHYKTVFKKYTIKWENVKLYSGFLVKYGKGVERIDKESLKSKKGLLRKMIFFTILPYESLGVEYNPLGWARKNNYEFIGFTYRREALDFIDSIIVSKQLKISYDFEIK